MPRSLSDLELADRKVDLIFRLYVDPADQDYISARWAYSSGLFHVFYWCAAQACEKYMKAFILLQDEPANNFHHNLKDLFRVVRTHDLQGIIPTILDIPHTSAMGRESWHGKAVDLYVDYLSVYGSSDNRYAFYGTFVNGPVLHALDIMCYSMRRIMNNKNLTGGSLFASQSTGLMPYETTSDVRDWMIDPQLMLERLFAERYHVGENAALRSAFSNMNFAFFLNRTEDERSFGGQHFHGSPLHNHLVRIAEIKPTPRNLEVVARMRDWAGKNIQMNKKVRTQLEYD